MQGVTSVVRTDSASVFIEGIAQNVASGMYNLQLPKGNWGYNYITAVALQSIENLAYELWFFSSASGFTAAPNTDAFLGYFSFNAKGAGDPGSLVAGNALYRYFGAGAPIPYWDADWMNTAGVSTPAKLHMRLVCRTLAGKTAGVGGALSFTIFLASQGVQA